MALPKAPSKKDCVVCMFLCSAGIAGAQMGLATLSSGARAPILNLRSVNSYVAGSWEEWSGQLNLQNSASRQHGPGPIGSDHSAPLAGNT